MRKLLFLMLFACPFAAQAEEVYTVEPCRILDTRLGIGRVAANGTLAVEVAGTIQAAQMGVVSVFDCGVPDYATAVFVNFVAVNPSGAGNMKAYASSPTLATVNNYFSGIGNVSNSGLVELCTGTCSGDFTVSTSQETDIVIDVTGFVAPEPERVTAWAGGVVVDKVQIMESGSGLAGVDLVLANGQRILCVEPYLSPATCDAFYVDDCVEVGGHIDGSFGIYRLYAHSAIFCPAP